WLIKRIVWRLQALAEGDLSERARRRAAELARDADLRLNPPQSKVNRTTPAPQPVTIPTPLDQRLPPPGTLLTRPYKGQLVQVQVLTEGFAYGGRVYVSLSAVAKAITGSHRRPCPEKRLPELSLQVHPRRAHRATGRRADSAAGAFAGTDGDLTAGATGPSGS